MNEEYGELLEHAMRLKDEARRYHERRMIAVFDHRRRAWGWVSDLFSTMGETFLGLIPEDKWSVDGIEKPRGEFISLKECEKIMGRTYPNMVMDFAENLVPNDLGKAVGVVSGGGLIIALFPPLGRFLKRYDLFHREMLTPPYRIKDLGRNFSRWVYRSLVEADGVCIIDGTDIVKEGFYRSERRRRREKKIPTRHMLPLALYDACLTQDQVIAMKEFERVMSGMARAYLLIADRGRGKSSVIGLCLAGLAHVLGRNEEVYGCITAPDFKMAGEVFRFIHIGMEKLGLKYRIESNGKKLSGSWGSYVFMEPIEAAEMAPNFHIVVVDEAASIPYSILLRIANTANMSIFSSTIHGYEGAGRSFSIRFMERLSKSTLPHIIRELTEPIRYNENDPIERWQFRCLMLDAEPGDVTENIDNLVYEGGKASTLLFSDENIFRRYFGVFVMAHYRNNPNDLGIILDGPNQEIRYLRAGNTVLNSVQIAWEGLLENDTIEKIYAGWTPPGNLIPDCFIKYYRDPHLARMKGARIVRIATHPCCHRRGLGTKMLNMLNAELKEKGFDYVGASFGASVDLINFWKKNGYVAIHISPNPNPVSGEHSVVMIKALSRRLNEKMEWLRRGFIERTIEHLPDPLQNVDPRIIRLLFHPHPCKDYRVEVDDVVLKRAIAHAWGTMNYVVSRDAVLPFVRAYFLSKKRPNLSTKEELLLIMRVLQCKSWDDTAKYLGKGVVYTMIWLKDIMKKLIKFWCKGVDDEINRYGRKI